MKADLTRRTYRAEKHYIATLQQQGRVPLDADWNEQGELQRHHDEVSLTDVIGQAGVPKGHSFELAVTPDGTDVLVAPGRAYVDGILCENDAGTTDVAIGAANQLTPATWTVDGVQLRAGEWVTVSSSSSDAKTYRITGMDPATLQLTLDGVDLVTRYGGANKRPVLARSASYYIQPEWWTPDKIATKGLYVAYLDVWRRHVTALEDPSIREVALGGPDTCTRIKTTWQLKLGLLANGGTCATAQLPALPVGGALAARALAPTSDTPCVMEPTARYRSLENQLYRVEIHDGGPLGKATFKFSADNGSFVTSWLGGGGLQLTVGSTGKDAVMRFSAGDWVELIDDSHEEAGTPGTMVQIASVQPGVLTLVPPAIPITSFPVHPRIRLWDQPSATVLVERPIANQGFLTLDKSGVEVRFEPGTYSTGDYWLIPARTITADVEWPKSELGEPLAKPHQGITHHRAKLGLVGFDGSKFELVDDCRLQFPPLTDIHASDVKMDPGPCDFPDNVKTVQDAISELCQQKTNACCELVIVPGDDVQSAIDKALAKNVAQGIRGLHVCFAAGTHTLTKTLEVKAPSGGGDITLSGCGLASHVSGSTLGVVIRISGWTTATVASLSIVGGAPAPITGGVILVPQPGVLLAPTAVLVMLDNQSSEVEGATITCGNQSRRVTGCIAIQTSRIPSTSEARVTACDLTVGNTQAGITITNAARSTVEGNRIDPGRILDLAGILVSKEYLGMLRKRMMSELAIGTAATKTVATAEGKVRNHVTIDHVKIAFTSDSELEPAWSRYLAAGGLANLAKLQRAKTMTDAIGRVKGEPVTELAARATVAADKVPNYLATRVATAMDAAVTKMLRTIANPATTKDQLAAQHLADFASWKAIQDQSVPAVMAYAIVVSGSQADDVRLLENAVAGAANGIRVALTGPPGLVTNVGKVYAAGRVQITGNTIELTAPITATGAHTGIFVGAVASIVVANNFTRHLVNKASSTAIRIAGVLGKSVRVEGNHAVQTTTGIAIAPVTVPPAKLGEGALWIVSQNVAENATHPIVAPQPPVVLINNVP